MMTSNKKAIGKAVRMRCRQMSVAICLVSLLGAFPTGSDALTTTAAPEPAASPHGYPMLLSPGVGGGVWFGGATEGSGRPETVDRVGYITPARTFFDFPFPPELYGFWPEAFARGLNGEEWFLARRESTPTPILGEISLFGQIAVRHLQVPAGSAVRGLAIGPDGNLWMADTRVEHHTRVSAILRMSPSGSVTAYKAGLQHDAIPENITDGPDGALWFIDTSGRIGRIDTSGVIKEFPVGHVIEGAGVFGPPPPIVTGADRAVWFVLDPRQLGRITPSGHVQIFTPRASLKQPHGPREEAIEELAVGPDRQLWFTRSSGAVLRIDPSGHVRTVTNRLVAGKGIAVTSNGVAWVGEEASFRRDDSDEVIPTRVARIGTGGTVIQYPEPPSCHVPFVLGDGPSLAAEELRGNNCELAGIRRPPQSHSNHLIVVEQSIHAGTVVGYKSPVRLRLGPKPPPPKTCRAPRYVRVLADSRQLVAWKNPIVEADNAESNGQGAQTYVACVPGHRAKHVFMTDESEAENYTAVETLRTAGHFIAFTAYSANHYNIGENTLVVFNALRGKVIFGARYEFSEGSPRVTVPSFALTSSGNVAWVTQETLWATVEGKLKQIGQLDTLQARSSRHVHVIETGSNISGLALHGRVLEWLSAGQTHSLSLP